MVAATEKKKRGRPKTANRIRADMTEGTWDGRKTRGVINFLYANSIIIPFENTNQKIFQFFWPDTNGVMLHLGIAEQVSRLVECGLLRNEDIEGVLLDCIEGYNNGLSVKELEKRLRKARHDLLAQRKAAREANAE